MNKLYLALLAITMVMTTTGCSQLPWKQTDTEDQSSEEVETNKENPTDVIPDSQNETEQNDSTVDEDQLVIQKGSLNVIKVENGKSVIQNPENIMVMVNKQFNLSPGYKPADLQRPAVLFSFGDEQVEKSLLRKEAAIALEKMFEAAKQMGIELVAVSGFRSYERQVEVYNAEVAAFGEERAIKAVAIPGQSEHQSGLAMDISSESNQYQLNEAFESTIEGKWLVENGAAFGFVLRYPKGKETITGYMYEPWHFRFVGIEAAQDMKERNLTFEEYVQLTKAV